MSVVFYVSYIAVGATSSEAYWLSVNFLSRFHYAFRVVLCTRLLSSCVDPGHDDAVNFLLRHFRHVHIDQCNKLGFTALMKAAIQGRTRCAKLLLFAGNSLSLLFTRSPHGGFTLFTAVELYSCYLSMNSNVISSIFSNEFMFNCLAYVAV